MNYIPSPSPQRLSDLKDSPVILMHIPGPGNEKKAPFKKWNESLWGMVISCLLKNKNDKGQYLLCFLIEVLYN